MLFTCVIEGRLTASPTTGHTREGREYVQFPLVHRDRYRDHTGRWIDARAMFFEVLCWGDLACRARNLTRGDHVVVEAGQLLPYCNDVRPAGAELHARNLAVSMRFADAHASAPTRARRGDIVVTPDGERYAADAYPEVVTDPELVHHTR
jgi:single-stranded DNA-binding protein